MKKIYEKNKKKSIKKKKSKKSLANKNKKKGGNDEIKNKIIEKTKQENLKMLDAPISYVEEYFTKSEIQKHKIPIGFHGIATCLAISVKIDDYYYGSHFTPEMYINKDYIHYKNWIKLLKDNQNKGLKVYIFIHGISTDPKDAKNGIVKDRHDFFNDLIMLELDITIVYVPVVVGDIYAFGINENGAWGYDFSIKKTINYKKVEQKNYRITKSIIDLCNKI